MSRFEHVWAPIGPFEASYRVAHRRPGTFEEWAGENGSTPVSFVVSENLKRRHLSVSQRAMLGVEVLPLFEAEAKERQVEYLRKGDIAPIAPVESMWTQREPQSRDRVAEITGASSISIQRAKVVAELEFTCTQALRSPQARDRVAEIRE